MSVALPLQPEAISLDDHSHSKKRVLERAAQLLGQQDQAVAELIFERLLERERLGSTGMVEGVALPHARLSSIQESRGAFIRLNQPVDFDAQDGKPVDLIFALIVPEEATQHHLQLLAELARLFHDDNTRKAIRNANQIQDIQHFFGESLDNVA